MGRLHRVAAALAAVTIVVAGCSKAGSGAGASPSDTASQSSPGSATEAFPVTLTDDEGTTITLEAAPRRIVTFAPANTEILFALGLGERVVGVSGSYDNFPPAARSVEHVGGTTGVEPNVEKVVSLRPDLLLATSGGEGWKKRLRDLGIPVFTINGTGLRDVIHDIVTVGKLTGASDEAARLAARMGREASAIESRVSGDAQVTCFYEVYFQPPVYTVGPGSFVYDLLQDAGCDPVTEGLKNAYPQLSVEAVVQDDPHVYLVDSLSAPSVAAVGGRPGYDALSAVREHRVYRIDSDLVTRPGPRVVSGLRALARALHPGAFR
jgi:iron complex transport system substrate-binding protein